MSMFVCGSLKGAPPIFVSPKGRGHEVRWNGLVGLVGETAFAVLVGWLFQVAKQKPNNKAK